MNFHEAFLGLEMKNGLRLKIRERSSEMKKKNVFIVLTTFIFCLSFMKPPAWAGNVQRNRWEGVAIGVGAAILGTSLINHFRYSVPARTIVNQHHPPTVHYRHQYRQKPSGRWEVRRVWIQPTYKRIWNPGHYNRYGRWVPGQWIRIEIRPGYWTTERIQGCR